MNQCYNSFIDSPASNTSKKEIIMAIVMCIDDQVIDTYPSSLAPFSTEINEIDTLVKNKADAMRAHLESVFIPMGVLKQKSD